MGIKLDLVGIVVKEMRTSLNFYRMLGLDIPESENENTHVEVDQEGVRLAFDIQETMVQVYGDWVEPTGHRIELAFKCSSSEDVDAVYAKLAEHGYGLREPWDAFWGQRYAIVQDPDGNSISLFA
ncbi:VOC family protein [Paenibacillus pasadenensis]|uniref:VOC family protein n=1 Tax=Paenibacillus pasadenensis TaxID=217090 RepID=UPI002041FE43|nr:VOC family protein [Paenibacillus pasadenensis]MCM3749724.1 VOC family protein [Paenibacillus pasadenensis]